MQKPPPWKWTSTGSFFPASPPDGAAGEHGLYMRTRRFLALS
uniref:Uncharacterized protein n=1 Tax=Arundo donax TaxID=35708 RepID=A0A0A9AKU1_ARUDO